VHEPSSLRIWEVFDVQAEKVEKFRKRSSFIARFPGTFKGGVRWKAVVREEAREEILALPVVQESGDQLDTADLMDKGGLRGSKLRPDDLAQLIGRHRVEDELRGVGVAQVKIRDLWPMLICPGSVRCLFNLNQLRNVWLLTPTSDRIRVGPTQNRIPGESKPDILERAKNALSRGRVVLGILSPWRRIKRV